MVLTCENTTAEQQQEQQELHRAHGEPWMLLVLFLFLPSLFTSSPPPQRENEPSDLDLHLYNL